MRHLTGRLTKLGTIVALAFAGCGGGGATPADADPTAEPDGGSDANEVGPLLRRCPTDLPGPTMVRIPRSDKIAFCVDGTEVTNAQYATFLAANPATGGQSERCRWNTTFTPGAGAPKKQYGPACPMFDPAARPDYPVVCVGWCDAEAYCRWAGKRLCQSPQDDGGGPVVDWTLPGKSEWVIACAGDDQIPTRFPYNGAAVAGRCVDKQYLAPMPGVRPVKEATMCVGSAENLFDMSGNAAEWNDNCAPLATSTDGQGDTCTPMGGSSSTEVSLSSCVDGTPFLRNQVAGDTGFRCCANTVSPF